VWGAIGGEDFDGEQAERDRGALGTDGADEVAHPVVFVVRVDAGRGGEAAHGSTVSSTNATASSNVG
jgi:hypothetical protein